MWEPLEERIDELIFEKAELADAVVRAGETKLTEMDFHRLRSLWQLDKDKIQSLRESMDAAESKSGGTVTDGVNPEGTASDSTISDDDSIPNNVTPFRVQKRWY